MTPDEAIEILWNYHHVGQELHPADLIFVLGSNDVRVAEYAAELYKRHLAPVILFSGGMGRFTGGWAVRRRNSLPRRPSKRAFRKTAS